MACTRARHKVIRNRVKSHTLAGGVLVDQRTAIRVNRAFRGVRCLQIRYHWFLALLTVLPAWHKHSQDRAAGVAPSSS